MGTRLKTADTREIEQNFPELNCEIANQRVWGTLKFRCRYLSDSGKLEHFMDHPDAIRDEYEIEILFDKEDRFGLPTVYERSGMIKDFAISQGVKNINDVHLFERKEACCLGILFGYKWKSAYLFILELVVPFLYWQSYYRKTGGQSAWQCYSHDKGMQEACESLEKQLFPLERQLTSKEKIGPNVSCPCGSTKKYKKCCRNEDEKLRPEVDELISTIGKIRSEIARSK